jgi:NAD(P)-dependent dehydrogenase (short-subunit alcohol dehydrogenase family)
MAAVHKLGVSGNGAVVTGAASGLGFAIAKKLAGAGYRVCLCDIDGQACARAAERIGGSAFGLELDVRDFEACEEVARASTERTGNLAVWVNNAGVLQTRPVWEQSVDQRRAMLSVNAEGTMNGTIAALNTMRNVGRGHIVNVVSLAGLAAAPGETVYAASKHAALAFSIGTLQDLRQAGIKGIHISALCPDGIWTPMLYDLVNDVYAAPSWIGTMLDPDEVAGLVLDLLRRPRPVRTHPRRRGLNARIFDAFPRAALLALPLVLSNARRKQRAFKDRQP